MQAAQPIAVVLADDHVVVRRGLRMALERTPGLSVVAEAGDAAEALAATAAARPDVLVLDLNMPGEPALGMLATLAAEAPDVAVVILTMEQDPAFARRAIEQGARGYVLKRAAAEELAEAIRVVAAGGTHVSPGLEAELAASASAQGAPDGLTGRETEVLRLIALGHTNAQIATLLDLSVRTVESHRTHIQQKLGASARPALVRHALDRRLI
ncbi:MAG: response regulator [Nitrososphaerota archaeon]